MFRLAATMAAVHMMLASGSVPQPGAEVAVPLEAVAPDEVDVQTVIRAAAQRYGVDAESMLQIAWCESRWDPSAEGPDGAAGLFQIIPETWMSITQRIGLDDASPFDPQANAEAAAWLMSTEGPQPWNCSWAPDLS